MYSLKEKTIKQLTPFSVIADKKKVRNLIIEGKSIQEGTPTPATPVEIQSVGDDVNLFDGELELGNINSAGNADNTAMIRSKNYNTINPSEEFTVSSPDYGITNSDIQVFFYDENKTYISDVWKVNFTTPDNAKYYRFKLLNNTDTTIKIKVQKGTVATPYSEYGKGTVEIKQSGKNLINPETSTNGYISSTGSFVTNEYNKCSDYIRVTNITYSFSAYDVNNEKIPYSYQVAYFDEEKKYINRQSIEYDTPFTINDTTIKYIRIWQSVIAANNDAKPGLLQLEVGKTVTEYEPYKGNNYVIPLSAPLRSLPNGTKDIMSDNTYRRVGSIVYDGSDDEGWKKYAVNTPSGGYVYLIEIPDCKKTLETSICSHFKNIPYALDLGKVGQYSDHPTLNNKYFVTDKSSIEEWKAWLSENPIQVDYELAEEVIEPFDEEQQAVINSMETFEGVNYFSLVGDLETTLTFDYNPQITEEIKRAFKYNITRGYIKVLAKDNQEEFEINEENYLKNADFDDCRYTEGEGIIGSIVAKGLEGNFVNVDSSFNIENREIEYFLGTEINGETHYLRLGTFIVQKPDNDNVKDNTKFDALDYMIKFNKTYIHRLSKYLLTRDTEIESEKEYYVLNSDGQYSKVENPIIDNISTYYEQVDEYTLMELLKDICDQVGVKLGTNKFRNQDFIVTSNPFVNGESCREVLKAIAQMAFSWARINEYNELLLDFNVSDKIDEELDYDEYYSLEYNEKYGPLNTIILRNSQIEGENVTIKDEELIDSPAGLNKFDLDKISWNTEKYSRLNTGILFKNSWSTSIMDVNSVLKTFKPNTTYTVRTKAKIISKPSTIKENNAHLILLYRPSNHALGGIVKGVSTMHNKGSAELNKEYTQITTFTTPEDMTDVSLLIYTYYGNNDGSTNYSGIGEIEVYDIMMVEGTFTEDNFPKYEPYTKIGPIELTISDNPFAYSEEKRSQLLEAAKELFGFNYMPIKITTVGTPYLNCENKIRIKNMQNAYYDTYIFDNKISYNGTVKSTIETKAMTKTQTQYQFTGPIQAALRKTELMVDKANALIQSIISVTESLNENADLLSADMQKKLTELGKQLSDYKITVENQFKQSKQGFEMNFKKQVELIEKNASDANAKFVEIEEYIRFDGAKIILGKVGNPLILELKNDVINFLQNNEPVAYFSNNKLYVTEAQILRSLRLGNFAFIPRKNGNTSFKKVGG